MNDDSRQATLNDLRDWRVFFVSGQMAEFRPLRRDSLCPSGASLVSTMPAPSGDNGGAIR